MRRTLRYILNSTSSKKLRMPHTMAQNMRRKIGNVWRNLPRNSPLSSCKASCSTSCCNRKASERSFFSIDNHHDLRQGRCRFTKSLMLSATCAIVLITFTRSPTFVCHTGQKLRGSHSWTPYSGHRIVVSPFPRAASILLICPLFHTMLW